MTAIIPCAELTIAPDTRGIIKGHGCITLGVCRLPTDPVGTTYVTFSGVPAGSEIRVYGPGQVEYAGIESCAADQMLSWPVYASGSPNNTVRIVIIDMAHGIKEFTYTSVAGNQTIPVLSNVDRWYSNP